MSDARAVAWLLWVEQPKGGRVPVDVTRAEHEAGAWASRPEFDGQRFGATPLTALLAESTPDLLRRPRKQMPIERAMDDLALAVMAAIERRTIETRTAISDALEQWAMIRFDVSDGSEINKLRDLADRRRADAHERAQEGDG